MNVDDYAFEAWTLEATLSYLTAARPKFSEWSGLGPLRCLKYRHDGSGLDVETFRRDQPYVAVSYSWPGTWNRLHNSNAPSVVWTGKSRKDSEHISRFMFTVFGHILGHNDTQCAFWVDHACINQNDAMEKQQQVAIMDHIYTTARFTAVMLEDIEMSTEDLNFLEQARRRVGSQRSKYINLIRYILRARWFTRAWCSQEMYLSRGTIFYLHRLGEPETPISFSSMSLASWISKCRTYGSDIPQISEPRGNVGLSNIARTSYARASGIVSNLASYNAYDKVSLVQNLTRAPTTTKLTLLPSTEDKCQPNSELNVMKMVNILAIQSGDFSLLQTGHVCENRLIRIPGFTWAGFPIKGDVPSEGWRDTFYETYRDPDTNICSSGLKLRGLLSCVLRQQDWKIWRDGEVLYLSVDGQVREVEQTWLRMDDQEIQHSAAGDPYDRDEALSKLRDVLYSIESMNAATIWPAFMPSSGTWIDRSQDECNQPSATDSLRVRMTAEYARPASQHRSMAQGISFLTRGSETSFSVLTLAEGRLIVVRGNIADMCGKEIFQPYIMRLREFSSYQVACNALVLQDVQDDQPRDTRVCEGHIRSLHLLPNTAEQVSITLR
jgi:hypothetical protein